MQVNLILKISSDSIHVTHFLYLCKKLEIKRYKQMLTRADKCSFVLGQQLIPFLFP